MAKKATHYDPKSIEADTYEFWLKGNYFSPAPDERPAQERYVIVMPPPNVTGALHLGHAINVTLQDILIRRHRMAGLNTLWLPGTDHAGIATQAVVETRLFEQEGKSRHDVGREGLVQRIWDWKGEYETRILGQLRLMGCSCDWNRLRFTLDEVCARAVRRTFFRLFSDGLIFRGLRLVNWDTQLQTAVADDEVYHETVGGYMWQIRYPLADGSGHLTVATTRPETMLGDTAVAVHPDDQRHRHLIGKKCILPLMKREIPIIADPILVKMDFGSGCVKVTPAHDPNDYECGQRNGLEIINILTRDGKINENGGPFVGLDCYAARKAVVARLEAEGLLAGVQEYETDIGHSDRSKTPIEPYLTEQWFVRMGDVEGGVKLADGTVAPGLAQMTMDAVEDGRVRFFPQRYAKTYLDWLSEKRDWCISRQLWWGHRIPVWSIKLELPTDVAAEPVDGHSLNAQVLAAISRAVGGDWHEFVEGGGAYHMTVGDHPDDPGCIMVRVCVRDEGSPLETKLEAVGFERDPDVLDTWFSSALWPHSTMGWPEQTPDFQYYYPTSVLVTSRDIITLWVARMVMTGLYNTGQVPFDHVYIYPKILDGQGRTMSKSLGNGVDPADIAEKYGVDAMRFSLTYMCTETQDLRLSVETETLPDGRTINVSDKFEIGRNFCNKLWQAATGFVIPGVKGLRPRALSLGQLPLADRWILSGLQSCIETVDRQLGEYRCGEALGQLYRFSWNQYCDWYVELVKSRFRAGGDDGEVARQVLLWCMDQVVRLLHPFIPFATEAIWQKLQEQAPVRGLASPAEQPEAVTIAAWPTVNSELRDKQAEADMAALQTVIRSIRDIRAYINGVRSRSRQSSVRTLPAALVRAEQAVCDVLTGHEEVVTTLGGCDRLQFAPDVAKPSGSASQVYEGIEVYVQLGELIDTSSELRRLETERAKVAKLEAGARGKLANEQFVARAPAEVVERQRRQVANLEQQLASIDQHLADLR